MIQIGDRARIIISTRMVDVGSIRFSIAHEIGHILCRPTDTLGAPASGSSGGVAGATGDSQQPASGWQDSLNVGHQAFRQMPQYRSISSSRTSEAFDSGMRCSSCVPPRAFAGLPLLRTRRMLVDTDRRCAVLRR